MALYLLYRAVIVSVDIEKYQHIVKLLEKGRALFKAKKL